MCTAIDRREKKRGTLIPTAVTRISWIWITDPASCTILGRFHLAHFCFSNIHRYICVRITRCAIQLAGSKSKTCWKDFDSAKLSCSNGENLWLMRLDKRTINFAAECTRIKWPSKNISHHVRYHEYDNGTKSIVKCILRQFNWMTIIAIYEYLI